ncbi:MAG: hypothetical protein LBG52_05075, partial [Candidatus Peribacteria bacterium]|nr:hypothetical protein [Candidatus Peribacteria bacterium]
LSPSREPNVALTVGTMACLVLTAKPLKMGKNSKFNKGWKVVNQMFLSNGDFYKKLLPFRSVEFAKSIRPHSNKKSLLSLDFCIKTDSI